MSRGWPTGIVEEAWAAVSAAVQLAKQRVVIVSPWVSKPAAVALVRAMEKA